MRVPIRPYAPAPARLLALALAAAALAACDGSDATRPQARPRAAVNASGTPFPIEVFAQAHQDDWQLFLGDRTQSSQGTAGKLVVVYTTAGDAGTAVSNPAFWQARETAANASVDSLTSTAGGSWSCGMATVNGHSIKRCTKASAVNYYLRLPDGNGEGQGYEGRGSLVQLRTGVISRISAVDGTTTYTSWGDLVSTFQSIVATEQGGASDASVALHVNDWNRTYNDGDHSDHINTGELVKGAGSGRGWSYFWYVGYPTMNMPINLTSQQRAIKWRLVIAYDDVMKRLMGETLVGTGHAEDWSWRTYFRSELSTVQPPPPTPPAAPTALQASAASSSSIQLAWTDNAADETGFVVEVAPDAGGVAGTYAAAATLGANVTSYTSAGLQSDTPYWFRVRATNGGGSSAYSNEAMARTLAAPPPPALPAAPTGLTTTGVSKSAIDLAWTDNAADETSYRVERAPDNGGVPGTWGSAVTLGADVTSYRASGLATNTRYWFRVRAQNANGNSAWTPATIGQTLAVTAPSGLTATAYLVGTTRTVDLRWTPGTETTVDIWRNNSRIAQQVTNNGGPYTDRPASKFGATITYRVCLPGKRIVDANCTTATATF